MTTTEFQGLTTVGLRWDGEIYYTSVAVDHGDRIEIILPDGTRGTIPARSQDAVPSKVIEVEYRGCSFRESGSGYLMIQVLGYSYADGAGRFAGCPCLPVTPTDAGVAAGQRAAQAVSDLVTVLGFAAARIAARLAVQS